MIARFIGDGHGQADRREQIGRDRVCAICSCQRAAARQITTNAQQPVSTTMSAPHWGWPISDGERSAGWSCRSSWTVLNSNRDNAALGDGMVVGRSRAECAGDDWPCSKLRVRTCIGATRLLATLRAPRKPLTARWLFNFHNSFAHAIMGYVYEAKKQWGPAIAECGRRQMPRTQRGSLQ